MSIAKKAAELTPFRFRVFPLSSEERGPGGEFAQRSTNPASDFSTRSYIILVVVITCEQALRSMIAVTQEGMLAIGIGASLFMGYGAPQPILFIDEL